MRILKSFFSVFFLFSENCEADDPSVTVGTSVTDNVVSVYVIILIVLGILFLIGAIAVVIIMRRMCISKYVEALVYTW